MDGTKHAYDLFRWARYRASQAGILFEITPEDILIPMYCPVFNMKLEVGSKSSKATSPTLDRIDNTKGYVKDNIWVISNLANMMKSQATGEQLILFAKWIEKKYVRQ